MTNISLSAIYSYLNTLDKSDFTSHHITILGNITVTPLEPYLTYHLSQINLDVKYQYGNYDNVLQDCLKQDSPFLNKSTHTVVVFLYLETLSWAICKAYPTLTREEINTEYKRITNYIAACLAGIRQKTDASILWYSFNRNLFPNDGIHDECTVDGQNTIIDQLNHDLKKNLMQYKGAYFINADLILSRLGEKQYFDHRYFHLYQSPFTGDGFQEIAKQMSLYIRSNVGHSKKCLVLDCDNVLWHGIIGEDGIEGIEISKLYPGLMFYEFQQAIVNLYHRGIIITLCSKNNEQDVWEVFAGKPGMLLKRHHIAHFKINWQQKSENLIAIAEELSIALNSIIFVDDSAYEIEMVNKILPDVATIHLPIETAYLNVQKLLSSGYFENPILSDEDRNRNATYIAQFKRQQQQQLYATPEHYYRDLLMKVTLDHNNRKKIVRLSQLTQKTNQFNLTSKRCTELDIENFMLSKFHKVVSVQLEDKFGDYGIIGLAILSIQFDTSSASIDTFLLSCRSLGRGVEIVLLNYCIELLLMDGIKALKANYVPNKANQQVSKFYPEHQFTEIRNSEHKVSYLLDLSAFQFNWPNYFVEINYSHSSINKMKELSNGKSITDCC